MDSCPQLLDFISKDKEWMVRDGGGRNGFEVPDEKKLELRLAPPGGEDWSVVKQNREHVSVLSLSLFPNITTSPSSGAKRGFTDTLKDVSKGIAKESSQKTEGKKAERLARSETESPANSQTKTSPATVVGWPPIRSFRKNLVSSSSKPSQNSDSGKSKKNADMCTKSMFVKINMDGIPIGRKVDLKANHGYERLSSAVDELFRGLLAAQREPSAAGTHDKKEENLAISGLLDGNGEYTLVYEDNEGDRMLVGDDPWDMFVSTVKRLRVLKSSDLSSALTLGAANRKRTVKSQPQNL